MKVSVGVDFCLEECDCGDSKGVGCGLNGDM